MAIIQLVEMCQRIMISCVFQCFRGIAKEVKS